MATPAKPQTNVLSTKSTIVDANQKAVILMAVGQLEMLVQAFTEAPERVQKAAKEFQDSLKEWANG